MFAAQLLFCFGVFLTAFLFRWWRRRNETATIPPQPRREEPRQKRYAINVLPDIADIPGKLLESLGIILLDGVIFHKPCEHANAPRAVSYTVFGTPHLVQAPTSCPECTQKALEALSERCAACDKGIVPGSQIAVSWLGASHPLTHASCAESRTLICGDWGGIRIIPLSEILEGVGNDVATLAQHLNQQLEGHLNSVSASEPDRDQVSTEPNEGN